MKILLHILIAGLLLFAAVSGVGATGQDLSTERVIVGYYEGDVRAAADIRTSIDHSEGTVLSENTLLRCYVAAVHDPEQFIEIMGGQTGVAYVEVDMLVYASEIPDDPLYVYQWAPSAIHADDAWDTIRGGPSVRIAIMDTGINYTHEDMGNYVSGGYDFVNDDSDPKDDGGHGTHCAGIAAAVMDNGLGIAGIAQVEVMAEKVLDSQGSGYSSDVAEGIIHAVNNGADVISLSLGGSGYSTTLENACTYAWEHGVVVVAASGNAASEYIDYPARFDTVIAVGSVDSTKVLSSFSNYGPQQELVAPGRSILSTYHTGGYRYMSGTSMATPHVAGVAALVIAHNPGMTNGEVRERLWETADDLGTPGYDTYYGFGLVNASAALGTDIPAPMDPVASFIVTPEVPSIGEPVTFDGSQSYDDGAIVEYRWDFGDGTAGSGEVAGHLYTLAGEVNVTLIVIDDEGHSGTYTRALTISGSGGSSDGPIERTEALIVYISEMQAYSAIIARLTASLNYVILYLESGNDGRAISHLESFIYYISAYDGHYITHTDALYLLGEAEGIINDIQNPGTPPIAGFIAAPLIGTAPLEVHFTDTSLPGDGIASWSWDLDGDGFEESSDRNPVYVYTDAGQYTVSLSVTGPGGSDTETKANAVVVTSPVDLSANITSGMAPLTVQFFDESPGTGIAAWSWDVDGDGIEDYAVQTPPPHTYTEEGMYTVSLTVSIGGYAYTEIKPGFIAVTLPQVDFSAIPLEGTAPLEVEFYGSFSGPEGEVSTWDWDVNADGTIDATGQNTQYVFTIPGKYTVRLNATYEGNVYSMEKTEYISVLRGPDLVITAIDAEHDEIRAGMETSFNITVMNGGDRDAGPCILHFESRSGTLSGYSTDIPVEGLGIGESAVIRCTDPTYWESGDEVTVTGYTDWNDDIQESNEANNNRSASFVVVEGTDAPVERINSLIQYTSSMQANAGIRAILISLLNNAIGAIETGNSANAVRQLQIFMRYIQVYEGRYILPADADYLIHEANEIIGILQQN